MEDSPKATMRVLQDTIVLRAEHLYHCDSFEYIGVSDHFRELQLGEVAPEYIFDISENEVVWIERQ